MIKLITDSASDITQEEGKILGIEVIPLEVRFGDDLYLDGETLKQDQFYDMLEKCKELPKTSQINPYRFSNAINKVRCEEDDVLIITLSSKLSGTYQSAKTASGEYNNVYVVDSNNVAIGERLLVLYAIELIKKNMNIKQIIDELNDKKRYIRVIAKLDTLKYLRKGGRISGLVAFAGETLNIKPIIGIVDGYVKLVGKGRGINHANNVLTKLISEYGGIDEELPFGTIYSGKDSEMLDKYILTCKDLIKTGKKINVYPLGCTVGTHIGPNGIGVAFFSKTK